MLMTWLPWVLVVLMLAASAAAYVRAPAGVRLPMQWGLDGVPGWRAPRVLAVLFSPVLAVLVLLLAQTLSAVGRGTWISVAIMVTFAAAHVGHLVFALRDVEAGR